ncbi:biotin transport system substrate-specific component [Sinorhizobium terangae]|uniref:Biotin transporter n=1 Tax=Sinorhizobium terangae TaxID=110322 RepID=A0A6N7LNL6_SINTE|nr:biotin transporter BioY [Sinorhizobium terangae]MBB4184835.1 biotin transport system substrate-specific component [Sinorhizobium terangae]MQX18475.1 BioY family transporter [Sinorhizobium terangae]
MNTRDLVLVALFAAIVVVLGLIPPITLGFIPVPITAQSMGVMLAGCIIGAKRGALAFLLFVLLVAIGLPVLSGGRGGLAVLAGPSGGFILGWAVAAYVTGLIAERFIHEDQPESRQFGGFFLASVVGGIVVLYGIGVPWLSAVTGTPLLAAATGSLAFIPGDLLKAAIATLAARAVYAGYPLLPVRA